MIARFDPKLDQHFRRQLYQFLAGPGWTWGWKSNVKNQFSFWHKHFAGNVLPDHEKGGEQYDCLTELEGRAPLVAQLWKIIAPLGHTLVRCYANGQPYGTEGGIHTDSTSNKSCTLIYYPHLAWWPDWGGETVFFNQDWTDTIDCVFPRPGRLIAFNGTIPHVARSVSRTCPEMRITLMFKTEIRGEEPKRADTVSDRPRSDHDPAQQEHAVQPPDRNLPAARGQKDEA